VTHVRRPAMQWWMGFASALEALRRQAVRSSLTMLGIAIGVGAVILLVGLGEGVKDFITSEFYSLGTNLIIVQPGKSETRSPFGPPPGGSARKLTLEDTAALRQRGTLLTAVTPVMLGTNRIKLGSRERDVTVIGTDENFTRVLAVNVISGQFIHRDASITGRRVCAIGQTVRLELFGDKNPLGELLEINRSPFRVVGLMEHKGETLGFDMDDMVFIPVKAYQKLFNETSLFGIRAKARSQEELPAAMEQVIDILRRRHHGNVDFTMISQKAMMSTMDTILEMMTRTLAGIAAISLLVGGIGIMNIMLVSVAERTHEIGLRKAVGARRRDILRQFLVESATLSSLGGLVGISAGYLGSELISAFSGSFRTVIPFYMVALAFGFSAAVGIGFGVYPAVRAGRLDPIQALRHE
jgi:putative ABC transport system permease protein